MLNFFRSSWMSIESGDLLGAGPVNQGSVCNKRSEFAVDDFPEVSFLTKACACGDTNFQWG